MGPIEISQHEEVGEESCLLEMEVNENKQPGENGEETRAFEMGPIEISQHEEVGEESCHLEMEVNENKQPGENGEETRAFEMGPIEISQHEEVGEESCLLEMEVNEDIDRLGIDYLRHSLPDDIRTFPMIAEKLKIPQEILYWSLENRSKFVKSMKVGSISVFNGRAMIIGCARAGKTTLVKKIKGDKDLTTMSTSGIEIHSHAFKLNSDESTIIVSTDEEKEKGCLCLTPGMLNILEEITQETSFGVNVNVVPDQSNVTSPRDENHVVDNASSLPNFTEGTLNNGEIIDDTYPAINESNQPINNLTASADMTPDTERSYETLEQNIDLNNCLPSVNMDNLKMLSLLDFAGHSAYYACHHIFFSQRAFFILVVDMTKELTSVATEACTKKGLIYSNWTYADYIRYWLGSIHTYSSKEAPVILVFSHSEDNGADPEKALEYFRKICECLPRKLLHHLEKRRIFSFQKLSNKNVEAFKECLAATVKSQNHWGERVPISWTKLEAVLKKLKESNHVFSFSNLLRYVLENNDLGINNEEDLLTALMFFNDTGVILFRSEIKDIIILDVQWFVDAFKRIIFDEKHMEAMEDMSDFAEFQELNEQGLLSSNVLNVLWQNSDFNRHKNSLVNHMKQLDMLAELSKELWYVPCMNKQKYPLEILTNCIVTSTLCFLFEFLPFIIYHRLVAACINKIEMKPWKSSERMCIFHTVTILTCKDDTHRVLIAICDNKERTHRDFPYSIEIQINVTKPREIDTRLTSKLKEDICKNLTVLTQGISSCEFYSHVGYRCRLETFGKNVESHIIKEEEMSASEYDCPKCSHPHIVDVVSIRRFWKKTIQDEPHTSSTMTSDILSDVGLMNVAKQLGAEWTLVVGHLGLKQAEIEQIKLDNPYNTINQITIALQRWRDRQEGQTDTTLQQLFSALISCERRDLLEEIQEKYNITDKSLIPFGEKPLPEYININGYPCDIRECEHCNFLHTGCVIGSTHFAGSAEGFLSAAHAAMKKVISDNFDKTTNGKKEVIMHPLSSKKKYNHRGLKIADEKYLRFDGSLKVTKKGGSTNVTTDDETNLPFFVEGDSGSGVFLLDDCNRDMRPLGIAFARRDLSYQTYACKIQHIAEQFHLSISRNQEAFATGIINEERGEVPMEMEEN
nr:uncharacterized protein LOC111110883 isoform X2 [Crassostrea virginica]